MAREKKEKQLELNTEFLAIQDRLQAEKELTERLFRLSMVTTDIRSRLELLKACLGSINDILPFDDLGLFIVDWEKDEHYEILAHIDYKLEEDPIVQVLEEQGLLGRFRHSGSALDYIMQQEGPCIYNLEKDSKRWPHPQVAPMLEVGFKELIGTSLKNGDDVLGMFCFNSFKEGFYSNKDFPLFQTIADHIAIALSSILANEKLQKEKQFSETLLKITEAIARVRTTGELYQRISEKVKPLLPFDRLGLLLITEAGDRHYELMEGYSATSTLPEYDVARTYYSHAGTSVEYFMQQGPTIISMDRLDTLTDHPQHPKMFKAGLQCLMGAPLTANGENFGMICFKSKTTGFYNDTHLPLFKAIAEQVAVGLSNILANDEIKARNEEQALEIKLAKVGAQDIDWRDKATQIVQTYKALIPLDYGIILSDNDTNESALYIEWLGLDECRILNPKEMEQVTKLPEKEILSWKKKLISQAPTNAIKINDLSTNLTPIYQRLYQSFSRPSLLQFSIFMPNAVNRVTFVFLCPAPRQFTRQHLDLVSNTSQTLALALANASALTEIKKLSAQLSNEKDYLQHAVREAYNFHEMIGESAAMKTVFSKIATVANVDANVLILGETGTGKELIARAIHEHSSRKDRVLIKVNCAAVPAQMVESELFGHEKGAFTGAFQRRIGKFELAHQGTIFLDEIAEMPLELQTKLLRVLQEREIERLGGNKVIPLNFRVIAATNRKLEEEVEKGKFRADLYFRLNTFPIVVPPLRQRKDDILLLADFFARQFSEKLGLPFHGFSPASIERLEAYSYPGNVRELQNIIEQATIAQQNKILDISPGYMQGPSFFKSSTTPRAILEEGKTVDMIAIKQAKDELERHYILKILEERKWKVSGKNGAAEQLGVAPTTLESRMKKLGISRK